MSHAPLLPILLDDNTTPELGRKARTKSIAKENSFNLPVGRNMFFHGGYSSDNKRTAAPAPDIYMAPARTAKDIRTLFSKLAVHMRNKYQWSDSDCDKTENENLPAGYTYLAQLVAHDMVQTLSPFLQAGDQKTHIVREFRKDRLLLETIYGGGPLQNPLPYEFHRRGRKEDQLRFKFRLGHILPNEFHSPDQWDDSRILTSQPPRDVARVFCPHLSDSASAATAGGKTECLLADPRNDDHLVISQLTALFQEFHNIVFFELAKKHGGIENIDKYAIYPMFLTTRKVVSWVYQEIIFKDLLPRLIDERVLEYYEKAQSADDFLHKPFSDNPDRIPVEFSHAAFRICHIMVRSSYRLNSELDTIPGLQQLRFRSSSRDSFRTPVASDWLIDWGLFFETGKNSKRNMSHLFRPKTRGRTGLADSGQIDNPDSLEGGLFYLDLVRGVEAGVQTVAGLKPVVENFISRLPPDEQSEAKNTAKLILDPDYRTNTIRDWLMSGNSAFSEEEVEALATDPPLYLFLLIEAADSKNGAELGILASIIFAEVFFATKNRNKPYFDTDAASHQTSLKTLFGEEPPTSMPGLIQFITEKRALSDGHH